MKSLLLMFILLVFLPLIISAGPVMVFFNCGSFYHPVEGPYLEVYFKIPVNSLGFKPDGKGSYNASAEIELIITTGKDTIHNESYTLHSPQVKDTQSANFNLVDLRRVKLQNGKYNVCVGVKDSKTGSLASYSHSVEVSISESLIGIPGIMLVDTFYPTVYQNLFSRNDYDFIPEVVNYYPKEKKSLTFYSEMYNADNILAGQDIIMTYYLTTLRGKVMEGFVKKKKIKPQRINYLFDGMDIKSLPDGTYNIVIEARDNKGALLATQSTGFFRNISPYAQIEGRITPGSFGQMAPAQIASFLEYLPVISTKKEYDEIQSLRRSSDTAELRQFFVGFWQSRNKLASYDEYAKFSQNVTFAQKNFKTAISKGYKTDRGRTLLKYGKPDYVVPYIDEQGAYPYEIWQYYHLSSQGNVHFVFYNPTLIENDYVLLNSEANGETKNPNWKQYIYKKVNKDNKYNQNVSPQDFGDHLDERMKE